MGGHPNFSEAGHQTTDNGGIVDGVFPVPPSPMKVK